MKLRQIQALMLRPRGSAEAEAHMARLEVETAWSLLATAFANDPKAAGLTVNGFEIVRLYTAAGDFEPDFRLEPHLRVTGQAKYRTLFLQLLHLRIAKLYLARAVTFRGLHGPCFARPA